MEKSLSHFNEAFNQELRADFIVIKQNEKYHVLIIADMGTGYGERVFLDGPAAEALRRVLAIH